MNMSRTMHLFAFGCGIGSVLFAIIVWLGRIEWIEPSKFYIPLTLGIIIFIWEYLVNKR